MVAADGGIFTFGDARLLRGRLVVVGATGLIGAPS